MKDRSTTSSISRSCWKGSAITTTVSYPTKASETRPQLSVTATDAIPVGTSGFPSPDEMTEPVYPPYSFVRKVGSSGNVGFRGKLIQVGTRFAGARVRVVEVERLVHIYHGDHMIQALTINPDNYYQPKKEREVPMQRTVT